jgi:hypothetical protein
VESIHPDSVNLFRMPSESVSIGFSACPHCTEHSQELGAPIGVEIPRRFTIAVVCFLDILISEAIVEAYRLDIDASRPLLAAFA